MEGTGPAARGGTQRAPLLVAMVGGYLLLVLFDLLILEVASPRGAWPTLLPAVVPVAATLWLAVRWPRSRASLVPVALGTDVVSLATSVLMIGRHGYSTWVFTESAALLALLCVAVRWSPVRVAVPVGVLTALTVCVLPVRFTASAGDWFAVVGMALIWGLGGVAAATLGTYLRYQDATRRRALHDVRAGQRLELARDLHDFVAHHVSGIVVTAQASRVVAEQDPRAAVEALARIEEAGQQALASMRRTVGMLRQNDDDAGSGPENRAVRAPTPGIADLAELVERFGATGSVPVDLDVAPGADDGLPPEATTSAYRVVLEALTNVRRHAPGATRVRVRLALADAPTGAPGEAPGRAGRVLRVEVHDDGPGHADGGAPGGFGLVGLRERVSAAGGVLTAGADPADGWTVTAVLPVSVPVPAPPPATPTAAAPAPAARTSGGTE